MYRPVILEHLSMEICEIEALPVDLKKCAESPSEDLRKQYLNLHVFEPYEGKYMQEIKKPSFDSIHKEPYMWGSTTSFKCESSAIKRVFLVKTVHRRGCGTPYFKPDLHEVLLQLPIKEGELWICTLFDRDGPITNDMWYGNTYVFVVD